MISFRITLAEMHIDPERDWELSDLYRSSSTELETLEMTLMYAHFQNYGLCFNFDGLPPGYDDIKAFEQAYRDALTRLAAPLRHTLH